MKSALFAAAAEVNEEERTSGKEKVRIQADVPVEKDKESILLRAADEVNAESLPRSRDPSKSLEEAARDEQMKDRSNIKKAALMVEKGYEQQGKRALEEAADIVQKEAQVPKPRRPSLSKEPLGNAGKETQIQKGRRLPFSKPRGNPDPSARQKPSISRLPLRKLPSMNSETGTEDERHSVSATSQESRFQRQPSSPSSASQASERKEEPPKPESPKRRRRSQPKRRENQRSLHERVQKFKHGGANSDDEDLEIPLCRLAYKGDPYKVYMALEKGSEVQQTDQHGWTALHWAASKGNLDVIEVLLEADKRQRERAKEEEGSDAEGGEDEEEDPPLYQIKDTLNGWTPLHVAVVQHKLQAVQLLLDEGADPDIKDNHGDKPIDCVASKKKDGQMIIDELNGDWWELSDNESKSEESISRRHSVSSSESDSYSDSN